MTLPFDTRIGILAPITWDIPPKGYGPWEKVVANLCKGLAAKGYTNVTLYATAQAVVPGIQTISFWPAPLGEGSVDGHAKTQAHIAQSISHAAANQDILHNHLNYHPLLLSDQLTIPLITTLHGSAIEPSAKLVYQQYRHFPFISISNAERSFLPTLNYIRTVHNGINFEEFSFGEGRGSYLAYAGRIHPDKGVHHAIELAQRTGMPLKFAGIIQDNCREYYEQQIAPHINGKNIAYLGNLSPAGVQQLVANATAYVGLIEWDEPFGLSIAEAMACGTPAIATPRGAHPEIVKDGLTGILVGSVDEAVDRFAEIGTIDRQHCREVARSIFSLEAMVSGYLEAYEKVLSKSNN